MGQKKSSGFTLLEIMIVVMIIGLFATFVIMNIGGEPHKARIAKANSDIHVLEQALEAYKLDNFNYPSTDQGLEALVTEPSGDPPAKQWKTGGYVQRLFNDPWGNPYQYLNPGERGKFDIYSLGADGQPGGDAEAKDIGNWDDTEDAG